MNGILLVDKPADWTSNDVVQKLRGILHEKRIGHAGTLDPMATGLLTVFVGRATRAVEFAEQDNKRYLAGLRLGLVTDTQDITGTVLKNVDIHISASEIDTVLSSFQGKISQIPPMYSAVKIHGQRLYKLAREGKTIPRAPREIEIEQLKVLSYDRNQLIMDIICSKGTYIRTLCHDIGDALGCGGCMSSLRRVQAGLFSVTEANTLDDIIRGDFKILPVDTLFQNYPRIFLRERDEKRIRNGGTIHSDYENGNYRLYSLSGEFLALGSAHDHIITTVKSFFER